MSVVNGIISDGNSSENPLDASAIFTGIGVDVLEYAAIIISVTADQPSTVDGLEFQFSHDDVVFRRLNALIKEI